ncbi:Competence protein A [Rosistilla carotiformis]|uniref:Competence protein A n=1 Tax=Rosistilla carotiformis TaxID=2528017 RepID=A0A518K0V7_9BACT|nr:Competence protein A [Rosistilla carotiformis]
MFEKCRKCGTSIRLGITFCGDCGFNAKEAFEKARGELKESLRRAMELGKEHNYEDAIYFAQAASVPPDFRFQDLADKAKELVERLKQRRDKYAAKVAQVVPAAKVASEKGRLDDVIQLLSSVPRALLSDDVWALAERAKASLNEKGDLTQEIRDAVARRDYQDAGSLLDRMLHLNPDQPKFVKLAGQVGNELMKAALKLCESGQYPAADKRLACVPDVAKNENYRKMRTMLDELFWVRNHLIRYPYATPALAKISKKLTKLTPGDPNAIKMHEQLVQRVESGERDERAAHARWNLDNPEFYRCEVNQLAKLQSIDCDAAAAIQERPLRFATAIGAALQGIGKARYDMRFAGKPQASGIKKLLQRKKQQTAAAWGLDIGPSSIRLVRMELGDGAAKPKITEAEYLEFAAPLSRPGKEMTASVAIREKLDLLAEKFPLKEEPVWILSPGRQALGRFLEMPPSDDKKLNGLIEAEVEHQFPVPPSQLVWRHWLADPSTEGAAPRYAAIIGVRDFVVDQQMRLFGEVEIEPAGMQVEPVALANLATFEFADVLKTEEFTITPPAIAILDVGVETSILMVCTENAFSYRTFDMGGDLWSGALARQQKATMDKADQLKAAIVDQPQLAPLFESLDEPFGRYNMRLKQMFAACRSNLGEFVLKGLWCTGGGCQIHGFMERIFSDEQ